MSRGELVEIGGSFRIPDIMALSRARMVEVGATNKTHAADYERALTPDTAMLLKVHPSNYRMVGFSEQVGMRELRALADAENARAGAPAGAEGDVLGVRGPGIGRVHATWPASARTPSPPWPSRCAAGCDLVSFSGDKLLGGPQAGIVVGSRQLIGRLKKNPLARAMRLDKMTLAALEATLRLYLDPETGARAPSPRCACSRNPTDARARARRAPGRSR